MKKFIEEIVVKDPMLARDIICALENSPRSGSSYDIELEEKEEFDPMVKNPYPKLVSVITVRRFETLN